jgi:hypothetical protein
MRHHGGVPRRLVVLLAVALVAAGCGARTDDVVTYGAGSDTPAEEAASLPRAEPGAGSPVAEHPNDVPEPAPPEGTVATVEGPSTTVRQREVTFASAARLGAGQLARVLLQPEPARRLAVEVLQQHGAAPRAGTVEHLTTTLGNVSRKRVLDAGRWSVPDERTEWTAAAINGMVDEMGRTDHEADLAVVHVLFLRGSFEDGASVLGVATRADTLAIFVDRVADASTALVGRGQIESAVAVHELGHLLGLVDLVVDTGRADPDHPGHSRNRRSVMYWAVESGLVTQVLSGGPATTFDDDDLADLAAMRNGA